MQIWINARVGCTVVRSQYNVEAAAWAECTRDATLGVRIDMGVIKGGNAGRKVLVSPSAVEAIKRIGSRYFSSPIRIKMFFLLHKPNFRSMIAD